MSLTAHYLPRTTHHALPTTYYLLLTTHYSLLTPPLTTYCLLPTTLYLPLTRHSSLLTSLLEQVHRDSSQIAPQLNGEEERKGQEEISRPIKEGGGAGGKAPHPRYLAAHLVSPVYLPGISLASPWHLPCITRRPTSHASPMHLPCICRRRLRLLRRALQKEVHRIVHSK